MLMKNQKFKIFSFVVFSFFAVILFWCACTSFAQEKGKISVYPSSESISVAPGKNARKTITILNSSSKQVSLKVSVSDFRIVNEDGKVELYKNDSLPAEKWLVPQYEIVTIPALDSKKMDYIATVSKNMPGQGYAGAIMFQNYDIGSKKVSGELFGTLIYLNVLGQGITTGGTIKSFSNSLVQFSDPLDFGFSIKNSSNSNLSASGNIVFTNIFGKEVKRFKTGELIVYPGSLRDFQFQWGDAPIFGFYIANVNLVDSLRKDNIISSWSPVLFLRSQSI